MKEPTKEQIKEFLECCGWIYEKHEFAFGGAARRTGWYLNGEFVQTKRPPIDLNNLFKYAVPKLQYAGHNIYIDCFEHRGFKVSISDNIFVWGNGYDPYCPIISSCEGEELALVIFWAIWEVICS